MNFYCTVTTCWFNHRLYKEHALVLFGEGTKVPHHFKKCRRIRGNQSLTERQEIELEGEILRDPATLGRALSCFAIPEETRKVLSQRLNLASFRPRDILDNRGAFVLAREAAGRRLEIDRLRRKFGAHIDHPELFEEIIN